MVLQLRTTPSVAFGDTTPVEGEDGASVFAFFPVATTMQNVAPLPPLDGEGGREADGWGGCRAPTVQVQ
jgi:hypothetical protein